jgi:hypothetical protein
MGPVGPKGADGAAGRIDPAVLTTIEDLKNNALKIGSRFRIRDGNNQYISKSGGGGKGPWEVLTVEKI